MKGKKCGGAEDFNLFLYGVRLRASHQRDMLQMDASSQFPFVMEAEKPFFLSSYLPMISRKSSQKLNRGRCGMGKLTLIRHATVVLSCKSLADFGFDLSAKSGLRRFGQWGKSIKIIYITWAPSFKLWIWN